MAQFEDNLSAAVELTQLDEASAMPELYPYRMISAYGQRTP